MVAALGLCLFALAACGGESEVTRFQPRTQSPTATPTGAGLLAYVSTQDGRPRISQINRYGSGALDLSVPTRSTNSQPAWSPDGKRIAFTSARDGPGDIFLMDSDGGNQSRLTTNPAPEGFAAWSPDGRRIAFASERDGNGDIYAVNRDGTDETRLTDSPALDGAPAWFPDGSRIAFESSRDGNSEIYTMNPDGGDVRRVTSDPGVDFAPAWSPDGSRIAFASDRTGNSEIYLSDATGPNLAARRINPPTEGDPPGFP